MTTAEPSNEHSHDGPKKSTTTAPAPATSTDLANSPHQTETGKKRNPMTNATKIKCNHCETVVIHDRRNVAGCNCDPDAPQWCYIEPSGKVQGFSQADWVIVE